MEVLIKGKYERPAVSVAGETEETFATKYRIFFPNVKRGC